MRSRVKYVGPAVLLAAAGYLLSASLAGGADPVQGSALTGDPRGLPMLLAPALIIGLFLQGKHLLHGLLFGLLFGVALGLALGLLPTDQLFSLDLENFTARSFLIDGINRAVGISFFTILLMGLVATLKAGGVVERLVRYAEQRSHSVGQAEAWIGGAVGAAVLLTTHSIVAILTVAEFANRTGERTGLSPRRRANLLSLVVCAFPFLLPYFIPVILMANTTVAGRDFGLPTVSPLEAGLYNFVAWGLLVTAVVSILFGYGRKGDQEEVPEEETEDGLEAVRSSGG